MKRTSILILFFSAGLSSCYYDNEEMLYPGEFSCYSTEVSFALDIKPLVDAKCATAGCHVGGTGRVKLTSYASIKSIANDGQFRDRVLTRKDMPPSGPLSKCEQDKIRAWLDNGATNN